MKLERILEWLDGVLKPERFSDVANNGLQIARSGGDVAKVAFAVDGSAASVRSAASAGAQLFVVHHGISWGGGIRRITDGEYAVVKSAIDADIALYASHLPLDANERCGNNWEIARALGLADVRPAFSYHGNVIGVTGTATERVESLDPLGPIDLNPGQKIGVCSGGAAEFAAEAKSLGCEFLLTGEASWGDVIAAENARARLVLAGHYETETFGVKALAREMSRELGVETAVVGR